METVRDYVNQALSLRAASKLKIRQPLASITVPTLGQFVNFEDVLIEELNVKKVVQGDVLALDLEITPELKREGYAREIIRYAQSARKNAGLNVDDRIDLSLTTEDEELLQTIQEFGTAIAAETLAGAVSTGEYTHAETITIAGKTLQLSLQKN
jgi:isoleucyl-tRNA synthetase